MKQARTNKTNQSVVWPSTAFFTIQELQDLNPEFVNITLRVRLANAVENGTYVEIGAMTGGKGRPQKVFSLTPVTKDLLDNAEGRGIQLIDRVREKMVNVVSVTSTVSTAPVSSMAAKSAIAN